MFSDFSKNAIKKCIKNNNLKLSKDAKIIFVCGAMPDNNNPTARDRFLDYAFRHYPLFNFFKAEEYFKITGNSDKIDMLSIEDSIAKYCDCLIIFVESASSIAELGAFANNTKLSKIMLIINNKEYKNAKSFISYGPIAKINNKSIFKPVIHADMKSVLTKISDINDRLLKIKRIYNRRVDISSYNNFKTIPPKIRMLFLYELILLFSPLTFSELIDILIFIYEKRNYNIRTEINLLHTLKLIELKDTFYYIDYNHHHNFFFYEGLNITSVRASNINYLYKNYRNRLILLPNSKGIIK